MQTPVYRIERDKSETIIGFAGNATEMAILVEADLEQIDYDTGYHWKPPEEEEKHGAERQDH